MAATTAVMDFRTLDFEPGTVPRTGTRTPSIGAKGGILGRPITANNRAQIRRRARRKMKIAADELRTLYNKPVEDWDLEELAKGRPRARDGSFKGSPPAFMDRVIHEQIMSRFENVIRQEMNGHTIEALKVMQLILEDTATDHKGRPRTSASTKLDAAKFLIEHVIGKPKQRVETDISVKLQAVLGAAMVNPSMSNAGYELTQGYIEAEVVEDEEQEG